MASIDKVRLEDLEEIEKVLLELSPTNETKSGEKEEEISMTVDMEEDDTEEIVILECNIFKYHGAEEVSSLDHQVSEGILKFQYQDEDDDDIIEVNVVEKGNGNANSSLDLITIADEDNDDEDEVEEDADPITDEERVLTCEECGLDVLENQLEDHKFEKHKYIGIIMMGVCRTFLT